MKDVFKPINGEHPEVPRVMRYRTPTGSRVVVEFGTAFGYPATRYLVRDEKGRVIKQGESVAISFHEALAAGLQHHSPRGRTLFDHLSRR